MTMVRVRGAREAMSNQPDFRAVFDASPNAYMLLDRELRYVDANRAYLHVTGSRLSELRGRNVFELFPDDARDPANSNARLLRASFEKVLRTRKSDVLAFVPYRVAHEPGDEPVTRLWSASHEPILDEQGEVAFILQHTVDVTELAQGRGSGAEIAADGSRPNSFAEAGVLRRAEQTAASNRALGDQIQGLRSMFEQAPGFVCFLRGPAHVYEMTNRSYNRLIGDRPVIGLPIRAALPELEGQGYFELLDDVRRSGKPFVGRGMRVELDRNEPGRLDEAILDFVYQPIRDTQGAVIGVFVQGQDVTERHRHEQRQRFLMRAGENLSNATASFEESLGQLARAAVPDFADWVFVDVLHAGRYERRIVLGPNAASEPLAELARKYPPRMDGRSQLTRSIVTGVTALLEELSEHERQLLAHDAEHLALIERIGLRSLCVVPLTSGSESLGAITFGLASTLRRYTQDDLTVAKELARMAAIALDNARLSRDRAELLKSEQAARERAENANQAKDEFLAMLGHELRNPLAPILTAVQLLQLRGGPGTREQTIIERQAQHLVRLLDDLLDVSRIARGKVELRAAPTDIGSVIAKAVEIASPLLEQHSHQLELEVPGDTLRVLGDEVRLSQIVANLLTNAARYTPAHGRVRLRAWAERDHVVLRVEDNGIGIDPTLLPKIFDLFVQGPRHSDRREGGLGLGLALVKNLVTMHGGTVTAESAGKDRGSAFEIRLPQLQAATEEGAGALQPTAAKKSGSKILVVDDNADAGELLALLLESRGYETALALDGPSALAEAARFRPKIAILDIGLPVMDGYELAEQLRQTCGDAAPKLIALTGYGQAYDRSRSHAGGFLAHLVKPVDAELLFRTVELADQTTAPATNP